MLFKGKYYIVNDGQELMIIIVNDDTKNEKECALSLQDFNVLKSRMCTYPKAVPQKKPKNCFH